MGWGLSGKICFLAVSGDDNSPALANADPALNKYAGDYSGIAWTGVPLWAKFFQLPARFRRNRRDDRFGSCGRADQVSLVHRLQHLHGEL